MIPNKADRVLRAELHQLPDAPRAAQPVADLVPALPVHTRDQPPDIDAAGEGTDIGVSIRGDDDCLFGVRTSGKVEVWHPSAVHPKPRELTCDPSTALAGLGQDAPH